MDKFLIKSTYRSIMKHAMAIDKDAALRAVLVAFPCSFYDPMRQQWTPVDARQEWLASRQVVDDFIRELNGTSDWYLPHRSIPLIETAPKPKRANSKKRNNRNTISATSTSAFLHGEVAAHVSKVFRSGPLTSKNLNNAFATVKLLSYVMQLQDQLPLGNLVLPDPRNLGGFEILKDGVAPMCHPSQLFADEEQRVTTHNAASVAAALGEARRLVAKERETLQQSSAAPAENEKSAVGAPQAVLPPPKLKSPEEFGLQLLVAHPLMSGFFRHAIVMLSQAGPSGALGFIINKPVVNDDGQLLPVWAFIPDVVHPIFTKHLKNNVVFIGGPVASPASRNHALFIIHRIPNLPKSISFGEGIYTTNDFNALYQLFEDKKADPRDVMVLLGYCGWGETQLEHEERKGSWVALRRPWDFKSTAAEAEAAVLSGESNNGSTNGLLIGENASTTTLDRHSTTADYVFSKNCVIESATNLPRDSAEPLVILKHGPTVSTGTATRAASHKKGSKGSTLSAEGTQITYRHPLLRSTECSAVGEPRLSWVSLFGSLGPKYRAMARLADVRGDPLGGVDEEDN